MLHDEPCIAVRSIRNLLARVSPNKSQQWTTKQIWYVRVSVLGMMQKMPKECFESYQLFSAQFVDDDMSAIFRNADSLATVTDEAAAAARSVWQIMMNKSHDDGSVDSLLVQFLNEMKELYSGFDFRISNDPMSGEITGVAYMTSAMRGALEKFGDYLSLDAMRHEFNKLHWPYIAPVAKREDGTICVTCESIVLQESHDAYIFVIDSMYEMAPLCSRDDVRIVSADGIMDETFVQERLRFRNARFIEDIWHLVSGILPKAFGQVVFSRMKMDVQSMIRAETVEDFNRLASIARCHVQHNASLLVKFDKFLERKSCFATYIIKQIPGNMDIKGSTPGEQNHSSVKSHLGKEYYAEIDCMVRDLLHRQNYLSLERTRKITEFNMRLASENHTCAGNVEMQKASAGDGGSLNFHGFIMWKRAYDIASKLKYEDRQHGTICVSASSRNIDDMREVTPKAPCPFRWCKGNTHLTQCQHKICMNGMKFDISECAKRWHFSEIVEKSERSDSTMISTGLHQQESDVTNTEDEVITNTEDDVIVAGEDISEYNQDDIEIEDNGACTESRGATYNRLSELSDEIVQLSCRLPTDMQQLMGGSLVALRNIARNGKIDKHGIDSNLNAAEQMAHFWNTYVNRFSTATSNGSTNLSINASQKPQAEITRSRKINRPKSNAEKRLNSKRLKGNSSNSSKAARMGPPRSIRQTTPSTPINMSFANGGKKGKRCTFCREAGHQILSCSIKKMWGTIVSDVDEFKLLIKESYPFGGVISEPCTKGIKALTQNESKHLQVHSIHPTRRTGNDAMFGSMKDLTVCVTVIRGDGKINDNLQERIFMDGTEFDSIIDTIGRSTTRYLFDNVMKTSTGNEFTSRAGHTAYRQGTNQMRNHGGYSMDNHHAIINNQQVQYPFPQSGYAQIAQGYYPHPVMNQQLTNVNQQQQTYQRNMLPDINGYPILTTDMNSNQRTTDMYSIRQTTENPVADDASNTYMRANNNIDL